MPISSSPFSSPSSTYLNLIHHLHPASSQPQILELDILPSSYPSTLYSSPPSLAVPKPLLASLFVTARADFFAHVTSRRESHVRCTEERGGAQEQRPNQDGGGDGSEPGPDSSYDTALKATRVMLLWDPNHVTAVNFRKKCLMISCSRAIRKTSGSSPAPTSAAFLSLLRSELSFLTSLVTSPLSKAPKSSTLWAHRLWLLQSFRADVLEIFRQDRGKWAREPSIDSSSLSVWFDAGINDHDAQLENVKSQALRIKESTKPDPITSTLQDLYMAELEIVLHAAERHPRNYYAWNYARKLSSLLFSLPAIHTTTTTTTNLLFPLLHPPSFPISISISILPLIHNWTMTHPRDISGWTFLIFLIMIIQRLKPKVADWPTLKARDELTAEDHIADDDNDDDDENGERYHQTTTTEIKRIQTATTEAMERFHWEGESVKWFVGVLDTIMRDGR